jgi:uncharacterized membrane protein
MILWLVVAATGVVLSLWGLKILFRRYRRGQINRRYLLAVVVGVLSLVVYAILSTVRPDITTGPVFVVMLLPAFIAIVVVIRERR